MSAGRARTGLRDELAQALGRGELFLLFQPQVDLRRGRVVGAEALCRWQHPRHGLLQPEDFLGALDGDAATALALADWALGQAVRCAVAWHAQGHGLRVGVNVDATQLLDAQWPARLDAHLQVLARAPSARLELELLESSVIADFDLAAQRIEACRRAGVQVALDDFGAGHSALAWLSRLPVASLKLDRAFVAGLPHRAADTAIVRHLVALAKELRLEVVAEGVESPAQGECLLALGCEIVQGFAIAPPLRPGEFLPWLEGYEESPLCPRRDRDAD
ncbi:MAG: EAL domain-containing protein [Pseudomonadota bacterium]|nr:EAL domain-containing protein [Pseudomonadota bacterium]